MTLLFIFRTLIVSSIIDKLLHKISYWCLSHLCQLSSSLSLQLSFPLSQLKIFAFFNLNEVSSALSIGWLWKLVITCFHCYNYENSPSCSVSVFSLESSFYFSGSFSVLLFCLGLLHLKFFFYAPGQGYYKVYESPISPGPFLIGARCSPILSTNQDTIILALSFIIPLGWKHCCLKSLSSSFSFAYFFPRGWSWG